MQARRGLALAFAPRVKCVYLDVLQVVQALFVFQTALLHGLVLVQQERNRRVDRVDLALQTAHGWRGRTQTAAHSLQVGGHRCEVVFVYGGLLLMRRVLACLLVPQGETLRFAEVGVGVDLRESPSLRLVRLLRIQTYKVERHLRAGKVVLPLVGGRQRVGPPRRGVRGGVELGRVLGGRLGRGRVGRVDRLGFTLTQDLEVLLVV